MAESLLAEVRELTKEFHGNLHPAIDRLTLSIAAGEVTGIVGPDGAGKTTLIRLLAGLMMPTSGEVIVCGDDTRTQTDHLRHLVSYMPQRFGLYEDLTVAENLLLYADLRGVVGRQRDLTLRRLLSFTALGPFTSRLAGKLSGGMKQKLGLACALIRKPRLLLLDEPSVGVDPISRRELWRMVYELIDQGIGVVWSTAYLDEAERCDTVLLLNEGEQLYFGPPKQLTARTAGRSYLVENLGAGRRRMLARVIKQPEVIDAVIQGASVRLVIAEGEPAPDGESLGAPTGVVVRTQPRFEDAFVDLLGGGPKYESPLGQAPDEVLGDGIAVVEAIGLTKQFGNFTAASNISFRIPRGEIYGLLGPNGAGKSTTFKMMCGLLRPTAGHAKVAGYDLHHAGGAARRRLGYMAQKFSLYGDLSVKQNLDFFAGVYGLSRARRQQAIARVIDTFNLGPYLRTNAGEIPLGFKQRLALGAAVMHNPPVLFLDEPTSGVDPLTRREFWLHINAMVEHGVTVLVTTHFLDEAEYCDRIGLVYQGAMIAQGSPDELKDEARSLDRPDPTLEDAFIALVEHYDREVEPVAG